MRSITDIHQAQYEPIADLVTYRAMPTAAVPMNLLDPFIFLNHHGYQEYSPHNHGLPFGPHPHRGFETVTFIVSGDLMHQDSGGGSSVIRSGGVQWMTAGRGLVHAEISSDEFKKNGGPLEILQLWVNLPAKYKMNAPSYTGLQQEEIPVVTQDEGRVKIHAVSGNWKGTEGPIHPLYDIALASIEFQQGGSIDLHVPREKNILLYVVSGEVEANGKAVGQHGLAVFDHEGENVNIKAAEESLILFGHATPFNEPFAAYGPFVMNTKEEIMQAYEDYNKGSFGRM